MYNYPLHFRAGYLFLEVDGSLYLIDTGSPISFGDYPEVSLGGENFKLLDSALGFGARQLSNATGVNCAGLIGTDILNSFDIFFDVSQKKCLLSKKPLEIEGNQIPIELQMGLPALQIRVANNKLKAFFDTGASISYFSKDKVRNFPSRGEIFRDFYPGFGEFETDTYAVDVQIGSVTECVTGGYLPDQLEMMLMLMASGVIGNSIFVNRKLGYFPQRNIMVLQ